MVDALCSLLNHATQSPVRILVVGGICILLAAGERVDFVSWFKIIHFIRLIAAFGYALLADMQ